MIVLIPAPHDSLDAKILAILNGQIPLGRDSGDDLFADIDPEPDHSKIPVTDEDLALMAQLPYRLTARASATASM